jgi:hypothetical protein
VNASDEHAAGHYRTSGAAIAFVGALGLVVGAASTAGATELHFIDGPAMMGFSLLYLVTAMYMAFAQKA